MATIWGEVSWVVGEVYTRKHGTKVARKSPGQQAWFINEKGECIPVFSVAERGEVVWVSYDQLRRRELNRKCLINGEVYSTRRGFEVAERSPGARGYRKLPGRSGREPVLLIQNRWICR